MTISLASSGTKLRRLLNHLDSESKAVARKKPQPVNRESGISMFTSLGDDAIQEEAAAVAEIKYGRTMPGWLVIEDMTTPQVAAATPNVCEGENGIVKCLETFVKPATRIGNCGKAIRKRGAATAGVVDGGAKAAKHRVVQSLRHTGLHLPVGAENA